MFGFQINIFFFVVFVFFVLLLLILELGIGTVFHGVHFVEVGPGGDVAVAVEVGVRGGALELVAVTFAEFFHFVAALDGGFGWIAGDGWGSDGYTVGHLLPVLSSEIASPERIPFFAVGVD